MQYLVGGLGHDWHDSFDTEEAAVKEAQLRAQRHPGNVIGIYKIDRVVKTEALPLQDLHIETIEGDVVKYLENLTGTTVTNSNKDCCESECY